jgi:hypothetical protein
MFCSEQQQVRAGVGRIRGNVTHISCKLRNRGDVTVFSKHRRLVSQFKMCSIAIGVVSLVP